MLWLGALSKSVCYTEGTLAGVCDGVEGVAKPLKMTSMRAFLLLIQFLGPASDLCCKIIVSKIWFRSVASTLWFVASVNKSETWRCAKHIVECTPEVYAPLCDSTENTQLHVVDVQSYHYYNGISTTCLS